MAELDVRRDGEVAVLTLSRPDRLNALTPPMLGALDEAFVDLDTDPAVRAIVVTGEGRGFCAGLDLSVATELDAMDLPTFYGRQEAISRTLTRPRALSTPVVAAVNGPASGGGLALALAADVRLAAPEAEFNAAFVRIGLTGCDVGVSWLLPRVVGLGHASELMLTGRRIDADEALRIGLVNRVVPDVVDAACALAREIAANTPFGVLLTKQGLRASADAIGFESAVALENRQQALASRGPDYREAVTAFLERRPPTFG